MPINLSIRIKEMLRKIYLKIIQMLDQNVSLKLMYNKLAKICCNHGINPPLSSGYQKSESVWRNQNVGLEKDPLHFVELDEVVELMFDDVLPFLEKDSKILEIGCNAGRSLNYLYSLGYRDLTGIEIGAEAENIMKEYFPETYKSTRYIVGHAYDEIRRLPSDRFDLVFCRAVMMNISPRWNKIFKEMSRISKGFILMMEREGSYTAYPRDFEKMFKKVGQKQIVYKSYTLNEQNKRILAKKNTKNDIFNNNTLRLFVSNKYDN